MTCSVEGCEKPKKTRGLCSGHYHRFNRYGDAEHKPTRPVSVCSVDGCDSAVNSNGHCRKHHIRFVRYGDPVGGGIPHGAARDLIKSLASSVRDDECVIWPYFRDKTGYARANWNGRPVNAHHAVCELAHGPRPTRSHMACHSCGKGHMGCVNPNHLYWGTAQDNTNDAIAHGTSYSLRVPVGENHHCTKFSDMEILSSIERINAGESVEEIASEIGISPSYLCKLRDGSAKRVIVRAANDNSRQEAVA